jgi:hypothetical protein
LIARARTAGLRRLAARLCLTQEVVNGGDLPHGEEVFFIDGRLYTYAEANAGSGLWKPVNGRRGDSCAAWSRSLPLP